VAITTKDPTYLQSRFGFIQDSIFSLARSQSKKTESTSLHKKQAGRQAGWAGGGMRDGKTTMTIKIHFLEIISSIHRYDQT
jgi:hypothetical protein